MRRSRPFSPTINNRQRTYSGFIGLRPVFVAFNATFDWSFTHWYFIKFLGRDPFGISGLDIKAYFMGAHKRLWSDTVKKKISTVYPAKTTHTHNALDDAKEQAEIFEKMLKQKT